MAVLCCSIFNLQVRWLQEVRRASTEVKPGAGPQGPNTFIVTSCPGIYYRLIVVFSWILFFCQIPMTKPVCYPAYILKKTSMLPLQYWSNFGWVYFLVKVYWQGTLGGWTKSDGIRSQKLHRPVLWPASCPSSTLQYTTRRWGLHTKLTHEEINEILKLLCVVICGMPWNWNFRRGL